MAMAPQNTNTNKNILKVLVNAKPALRKAILNVADKNLVHSICEICDNTLLGNIPLSGVQKSQIQKHKKVLRNLATRRQSWKKKKEILVQRGGAFLPILLSILSSVLPAVLGH